MSITTTTVQFPSAAPHTNLTIEAYLAQPHTPGPHPAIVVIQEIFGVNAHIRAVTERIAALGYVAIAPALYQRTAPGFEVGYSEAEITMGRKYKDLTTAPELLADIQGAIHYLNALPTVQPGPVGTIGFCFGGHVAYLAATLPEVGVTASFYGGGIATFTPGGGNPTLSRTAEIQGTVYCFFGTADPLIPNDQVDQVEAALTAAGDRHRVFRYPGAGHGFVCDQRADYRPDAYADAWKKVQGLFQQLQTTP
ncbi:MAG: dienelactone hydrolase family protein [Prochlorothrix sp.]|nr:dienelactone hydrolase family protein [Prochlorothrix sp.]